MARFKSLRSPSVRWGTPTGAATVNPIAEVAPDNIASWTQDDWNRRADVAKSIHMSWRVFTRAPRSQRMAVARLSVGAAIGLAGAQRAVRSTQEVPLVGGV